MLGADDALGEDEVDDVEEDCAGLDEDIGGETQANVVWMYGPGETEAHGYDAAHAEA